MMGRSYTVVPDWMLDLGLDIWETVILAVIYGFSMDYASAFQGSWAYLQRKACCSRHKVKLSLDHLVELGYINKRDIYVENVKICRYCFVLGSTSRERVVPGGYGGSTPEAPKNIDSTTSNYACIDNYNLDNSSKPRTRTREKGTDFDFRQALLEIGVTPAVADDWLAVRKTKRATNTASAFRNVKAQIAKSGRPADDCIRFAAERSWSGFRASWMAEDEDRSFGSVVVPRRQESIIEHYQRVNQQLRERYGNKTDNQ